MAHIIPNETHKMDVLAGIASSKLSSLQRLEEEPPAKNHPKEHISLLSTLPLPSIKTLAEEDPNPTAYLERLFARHGIRLSRRRVSLSKGSVPPPSFEEVDAYSKETAGAVREGDLNKLKELYYEKGFSLSASNRFGESLLHVCCRRGHTKMAEFMMREAKVNPRVIDDMGRTAFHDVCWSSHPNLEIMDVLLSVLPPIGLLLQDCRGHTPFQYAPRKHWGIWLEYLQQREHVFVAWIEERKSKARVTVQQGTPHRIPARVSEMSPSA